MSFIQRRSKGFNNILAIPDTTPAASIFDEDEAWWSGAQYNFACIPIALAALALSASVARAGALAYNDDLPSVAAPAIVEEGEWAPPVVRLISSTTQTWVVDDDLPRVALDDDGWQVSFRLDTKYQQAWPVDDSFQPPQFVDDTDAGWAPAQLKFGYVQQPFVVDDEVVSQPTTFIPDEDYWRQDAPRVVAPQPVVFVDEDLAHPLQVEEAEGRIEALAFVGARPLYSPTQADELPSVVVAAIADDDYWWRPSSYASSVRAVIVWEQDEVFPSTAAALDDGHGWFAPAVVAVPPRIFVSVDGDAVFAVAPAEADWQVWTPSPTPARPLYAQPDQDILTVQSPTFMLVEEYWSFLWPYSATKIQGGRVFAAEDELVVVINDQLSIIHGNASHSNKISGSAAINPTIITASASHAMLISGRGSSESVSAVVPETYEDVVLQLGPIAHWRLDGSNAVALDSSGNGNHGALAGAITTGQPGALADGDPAYAFDNLTNPSKVLVPTSGSLESIIGTSVLSMEVWLNIGQETTAQFPDSGPGASGAYILWWSGAIPTPGLIGLNVFYVSALNSATGNAWWGVGAAVLDVLPPSSGNSVGSYDSNTSIPILVLVPHQWYHIVVTFDGAMQRLYINGVFINQEPITPGGTLNLTDGAIIIGNAQYDLVEYGFTGLLDDISIYDRVLTPEQIAHLYSFHGGA